MNKTSTLKDFQIISKLGQGSFSLVYKVRKYNNNSIYALKKVKMGQMTQKQKQNALNQIRILASIQHPNIINYKQAFFQDSSQTLCTVMQLAEAGDLLNKVQEHIKAQTYFKQSQIWKILVHISKGLKALHDCHILHRDLKCANIFCTNDGVYKLGDLNVSKILKRGMARTQTGTPYYTSPEIWKDRPYDLKCDIWSLGCLLYQISSLKPPFRANNLKQLYQKIQKGLFERIPNFYSDELQNVIVQCLKINPTFRPTTQQLLKNQCIKIFYNPSLKQQKKSEFNLLKTIDVPKNLNSLKQALPKAKYENYYTQSNESQMNSKVRSQKQLLRIYRGQTPKISERKQKTPNRKFESVARQYYQQNQNGRKKNEMYIRKNSQKSQKNSKKNQKISEHKKSNLKNENDRNKTPISNRIIHFSQENKSIKKKKNESIKNASLKKQSRQREILKDILNKEKNLIKKKQLKRNKSEVSRKDISQRKLIAQQSNKNILLQNPKNFHNKMKYRQVINEFKSKKVDPNQCLPPRYLKI